MAEWIYGFSFTIANLVFHPKQYTFSMIYLKRWEHQRSSGGDTRNFVDSSFRI